jgi:hypothetical protein
MEPIGKCHGDVVSTEEGVLTAVAYSSSDFDPPSTSEEDSNDGKDTPPLLGELDFSSLAKLYPLPPDSTLQPLLRDGVTSILKEGCLLVQHAGLTVAERQQVGRALSPSHAKDSSDALWYERVMEHGAKRFSSKSLAARHCGEMQIVATDVGGEWRASDHKNCEFIPFECDLDVGVKRAQVALRLVRETICTEYVFVWYGARGGAALRPNLFSGKVRQAYPDTLLATGRFRKQGDELIYVSPESGFLIMSDQVRSDSSTAAGVGRDVVCGYLELPEIPHFTSTSESLRLGDDVTDSRSVLLIDAAGLSLDDQMRQSLLKLCSTARRLVAVSLCGATGVDATFIEEVAKAAPSTLRWIKVSECFVDGTDVRVVPGSAQLTEDTLSHVTDVDRRRLLLREACKCSHFFLSLTLCAILEDSDDE